MKRSSVVLFFLVCFGSVSAQQELTLEQAVALALNKNFDVQLAQNAQKTTASDDRFSIGLFLPLINASASTARNANNQRIEFGGNRDSLNRTGTGEANNMVATVQLNWVLFDGTKMFITRNRLETLDEQAQLNLKGQMVNTVSTVILNYYDIVRQKQQLRAIEEQMAVSEERVKLATRKLDVGIGAKPELLQAKVDYNAFKTQAFQQQASIQQLKEQLNVLTGLQLETPYEVADTILIDLDLQQAEIQESIETKNYALLSAMKSVEAARFAVRERWAELSPVISLNAAYNYNRTNNIVLINPFSPAFSQSDGYNVGFGITLPILNNLTRSREIQKSRITLNRQWVLYNQNKATVQAG
ncbi:MAG TPA: TolC family protein, partial [Cyclobacteriaceae bacterium]|nr:TolC family protein [Cyclobacteriaceae bacterium]